MKKIQISILSVAVLSVVLSATPVFAISTTIGIKAGVNANASTTRAVKLEAALATRIKTAQDHANQEIDRRTTALTDLMSKVSLMVRVSADQKASISDFINQQISALATLKTKISADADIATLKTDIKSITDSYRIFMLVMPQVNVIRTTDALVESGQMLNNLGTKLQTRITAAETTGSDISTLKTLMSDFNLKLNDAQTQTQAAVNAVISLKPDQGDKTTMDVNKAAFTTARADIKASRADLQAARNDAGKIVTALKNMKVSGTVSATSNTTSSGDVALTGIIQAVDDQRSIDGNLKVKINNTWIFIGGGEMANNNQAQIIGFDENDVQTNVGKKAEVLAKKSSVANSLTIIGGSKYYLKITQN